MCKEALTGFLFKYELVEISGKSDEEKAKPLVSYLDENALCFYLEVLTEGTSLTAEGKAYNTVNNAMVSKCTKEKADAGIIQDAVDLSYEGEDIHSYMREQALGTRQNSYW